MATRGTAGMDTFTAAQVGLDTTYTLQHDELFAFDVHGFIVLRGLLSDTELAAAVAEGAGSALLVGHPGLLRYVHALASPPLPENEPLTPEQRGAGSDRAAYLDIPLRELPELGPADVEPPMTGGDGARFRHSRAWVRRFGKDGRVTRYALGLRVVWCLADSPAGAGGLHLLPASHTCGLPCPRAVRTGELDLTIQPALRAGDCVLMSSNLAYGMRRWNGVSGTQRLLECEFIGPTAAPSTGIPLQPSLEKLAGSLTAAEKAVLGITPPPPEQRPDGADQEPALDLYEWELNGFLILRNVVNPATIATALQAIEAHGGAGPDPLGRDGDPIGWEAEEGAAFREMMMNPISSFHTYELGEGRTHTGSVNTAFQLLDVTDEDGGFVVIPGSHRASVPLDAHGSLRQQQIEAAGPSNADDWATLEQHDPSAGGLLGVVHPTMKAGDVLFFMGGATLHGSIRYTEDAPHARRIFLTNWLSRDVNLRGPPPPPPSPSAAGAMAKL